MGPVYYVIAILGCGDGSVQCAPVATVPTEYTSEAECSAATQDVLLKNSDLDFPTLVAQCRKGSTRPAAASKDHEKPVIVALKG
jgi:hypothetical protein